MCFLKTGSSRTLASPLRNIKNDYHTLDDNLLVPHFENLKDLSWSLLKRSQPPFVAPSWASAAAAAVFSWSLVPWRPGALVFLVPLVPCLSTLFVAAPGIHKQRAPPGTAVLCQAQARPWYRGSLTFVTSDDQPEMAQRSQSK